MQIRRHITLLATVLALVASISSGGGVSRFVHLMLAHGGATACAAVSLGCHAAHAHGPSIASANSGSETSAACNGSDAAHDPTAPTAPTAPSHDCAACAELAVNLLAPTLLGFFSTSVEVLAIAHDREAAQMPAPHAPEAIAARPPPFLA
ncbi:MAG: hypothetical protein ACKO3W_11120 [bacterium]